MVCWDAFPLSTQILPLLMEKEGLEFHHIMMNHLLMAAICAHQICVRYLLGYSVPNPAFIDLAV